jgi:DNA replication protein DnaC
MKHATDLDTLCPECGTPYKTHMLLGRNIYSQGCDCDLFGIEQQKRRTQKQISCSDIPHKYRVDNLLDWVPVPGTKEMYEAAMSYVKNAEHHYKRGSGLLFAGTKGTGKTKLQCFIGMQYMINHQIPVKYISLTEFVSKLESIKRSYERIDQMVKEYINASVLILDDVGESKIEEWNRKYVFLLIDGRNNRKCVTLVNTMRDYKTQCEYIGAHNVSRIQEMVSGNIVEVKSNIDMRVKANRDQFGRTDANQIA